MLARVGVGNRGKAEGWDPEGPRPEDESREDGPREVKSGGPPRLVGTNLAAAFVHAWPGDLLLFALDAGNEHLLGALGGPEAVLQDAPEEVRQLPVALSCSASRT
jgi:hypothetical protein